MDNDRRLARTKDDWTKSYIVGGNKLGPDCAWMLVSSRQVFFICNVRSRKKGAVYSDTFVKFHIN